MVNQISSFLIFCIFFVFFFVFFLALRTYTSVDNISIYSYIHSEYVYIYTGNAFFIYTHLLICETGGKKR